MGLLLGRIFSILIVAGGWLLIGVRLVLDLIGYSTLPEDVRAAQTRLGQFFDYILQLPWWAVWAFALVSTLWLIWVSWPRQMAPYHNKDDSPDSANTTRDLGIACIKMGSVIRLNAPHYPNKHEYFYELRPEIHSLGIRCKQLGLRFEYDTINYSYDYAWLLRFFQYYFSEIGPLIRDGHLEDAKIMANAFFESKKQRDVTWPNRPKAEPPKPEEPQESEVKIPP